MAEIEGSPFDTGWFPYAVVRNNSNPFGYVANNGGGTISAFHAIGKTGAPEKLAGSSYETELDP